MPRLFTKLATAPTRRNCGAICSTVRLSDRTSFDARLRQIAGSSNLLFLIISDNATGTPVGLAADMRIEPAHHPIEVVSILLAFALQRTSGATEAMYLMARRVFEDLGYRRYEWWIDLARLATPGRIGNLRGGLHFDDRFALQAGRLQVPAAEGAARGLRVHYASVSDTSVVGAEFHAPGV